MFVLDRWLDPVPAGVAGELYMAGAQLARGYLRQPGLTGERFVACPFGPGRAADVPDRGPGPGGRPGGELVFAGRADDQVKIRGFRVEPGEAEAVLAGCPGVAQAVVTVREDAPGEKRLVGYLVPAAGGDRDGAGLAAGRASTRPPGCRSTWCPSALVVLEELPLTPAGKLDRAALPAPEPRRGGGRAGAGHGAPRSCCAACSPTSWALERVGPEDDFFALGGHSLLAVRLVERLREQGLQVPVRALFEAPTPERLAAVAGPVTVTVPPNLIPDGATEITPGMLPLVELTGEQVGQIVAGVDGGAANVADIYPLAPLQEGMFFHHLMAGPDTPDVYLTSMVLGLESRGRLEEFIAALGRSSPATTCCGRRSRGRGCPSRCRWCGGGRACRSPR